MFRFFLATPATTPVTSCIGPFLRQYPCRYLIKTLLRSATCVRHNTLGADPCSLETDGCHTDCAKPIKARGIENSMRMQYTTVLISSIPTFFASYLSTNLEAYTSLNLVEGNNLVVCII